MTKHIWFKNKSYFMWISSLLMLFKCFQKWVWLGYTKNTWSINSVPVDSFTSKNLEQFAGDISFHTFVVITTGESNMLFILWITTKFCQNLNNGDPKLLQNYRPISILCIFSKLFGIIWCDTIYTPIKTFISVKPHGSLRFVLLKNKIVQIK